MIENFKNCLAIVLKEEGGNSDDPYDHGGRTSRGITQREYDAYRSIKSLPPQDVWQATNDEVADIYLTQYWNPYCDGLPKGVDLVFFDFCVNAGRQQAVKVLQRSVRTKPDGMFGLRTKTAVDQCKDIGSLIHNYSDGRRSFYRALKQFPRYGRGWLARAARVEKLALDMADAVPFTKSPKANAADKAKPVVGPEIATATVAGSSLIAGVLSQIQELYAQLIPYQGSIAMAKYALVGLACLGVIFTVIGILQRDKINADIG